MSKLVFVTENMEKFKTAEHTCKHYGIELERKEVNVPEIQSEDSRAVALDKAVRAFESLGVPLIITDNSWSILGLNGFPGVYMHSINAWFNPDNFLDLTRNLKNRQVSHTVYLVYVDKNRRKVFKLTIGGQLLKTSRGKSKHPSLTVMTLDGDDGLSIAEAYNAASDKSTQITAKLWHDFAKWYVANPAD